MVLIIIDLAFELLWLLRSLNWKNGNKNAQRRGTRIEIQKRIVFGSNEKRGNEWEYKCGYEKKSE